MVRIPKIHGGIETMKGFEIKRENEKPIYLFNRFDVVSAIAHAIYYTANPESEMCIPNCAYERAEVEECKEINRRKNESLYRRKNHW